MSCNSEFKSEYDLYMHVINDVIANVHQAFLEDGKDESILQDLKETWQEKLIKSKVVEKSRPLVWSSKARPQFVSALPNHTLKSSRPPQLLKQPILQKQPELQKPQILQKQPQQLKQPIHLKQPPQQLSQQRPSVLLTISNLLAQSNIIPTRNRAPSQLLMVRNTSMTNQQAVFQPQSGLLPQVVTSNQSPILNIPTIRTTSTNPPFQIITQGVRPAQTQQIQTPTRIFQLQLPVQRPQQPTIITPVPQTIVPGNWNNITSRPAVNGQIFIQPQVATHILSTNGIIRVANTPANQITIQRPSMNGTNFLNPSLTLTSTKKLRQVDGPDIHDFSDDDEEEEILANTPFSDDESETRYDEEPEEPEHNIDEIDAPTLSDIEDMMDCDNLLVCLFSKVTRKKGKFTIKLKMGVLNYEGKEYAFSNCEGFCEMLRCTGQEMYA